MALERPEHKVKFLLMAKWKSHRGWCKGCSRKFALSAKDVPHCYPYRNAQYTWTDNSKLPEPHFNKSRMPEVENLKVSLQYNVFLQRVLTYIRKSCNTHSQLNYRTFTHTHTHTTIERKGGGESQPVSQSAGGEVDLRHPGGVTWD